VERIQRASESLTRASHKIAEMLYREAQAKQQPGGGPGPASGPSADGKTKAAEGEVVDAEFEDLGGKH
jgi:molecular chaperone DnaK